MKNCLICKRSQFKIIWNDKIRISKNKFSKNKNKILQCKFCELAFLKKRVKFLEDSSVVRNVYNKDNSISEFFKFHTDRELEKLNYIKKYVNLNNKKILESNCGAGIIINKLKNKASITSGLDSKFYKKYIESKGHEFFTSIKEIIKNKKKFDIIFSLSEIEHKFDPQLFIKNLKKILSKNGLIIFRIPNFFNIYMYLLGKKFFKYDYRLSHNFYFSEKNLDILFKRNGFKTIKKTGYNEYSFNHLLTYILEKKRINKSKIKNIFNKKDSNFVRGNIEDSFSSTSLIYILKSG